MAWTSPTPSSLTPRQRAIRTAKNKEKRYDELAVRSAKRLAMGKGGAATFKRSLNSATDVSKHTGGVDVAELVNRRRNAPGYRGQ